MADDEWKSLPLQERLVHKSWKCRSEAYEEVAKRFGRIDDPNSDEYTDFLGLVPKFVVDANAVSQAKGVAAALAFVKNADCVSRIATNIVSGIVAKCLNARAQTKETAVDICLELVAVCDKDTADAVIASLMEGFANKQPKIVAASISSVTLIIRSFGVKGLSCKPILSQIAPLWSHSDPNVRKEVKELATEFVRWFGRMLVSTHLEGKVRDQQLKEFNELADSAESEGKAKPTRLRRGEEQQQRQQQLQSGQQQQSSEADGADPDNDNNDDDEEEQGDPWDMLDGIDLLARLPASFHENIVSKKWQERKEAVEQLAQVCAKNPKVNAGDYGEVVQALKKAFGDSNVLVVAFAAKCVGGMAQSMRAAFAPFASTVLAAMLSKFKEKKANVVAALRDAVDAVFRSVADLSPLSEYALTAMADKNPQIRAETMLWLARGIPTLAPAPKGPTLKPLNAAFVGNLDNSAPEVRDAAAQVLGAVLALVGERPMGSYLDSMDKTKADKVREYAEKCAPKASTAASSSRRTVAKPSAASSSSSSSSSSSTTTTSTKTTTTTTAKKAAPTSSKSASPATKSTTRSRAAATATASSSASAATRPGKVKGKAKSGTVGKQAAVEAPLPPAIPAEEVEDKAAELLPAALIVKLRDTNWKMRLEGCQEMSAFIEANPTSNADIIVRMLAKKPGWKEVNFQVISAAFNACAKAADVLPSFNRRTASYVVPGCVGKLHDVKVKASATAALTMFVQASSLDRVAEQVCSAAAGHKVPKVIAGACEWIQSALVSFGARLNVKVLVSFVRECLSSSNGVVRAAAVSLIGTLRVYVGERLRDVFSEEKPALLAVIDAEIDKRKDDSPAPPSLKFKSDAAMADAEDDEEDEEGETEGAGAASQKKKGGRRAANDDDDDDNLFPRVDISGKMTGSLMAELDDANWKVRGEALETVAGILKAARGRIQANVGDLPVALKRRLADSNKNHVCTTLSLTGELVAGIGSQSEKFARVLLPGTVTALGDSKATVRGAVLGALDKWEQQIGLEGILGCDVLVKPLATEKPTLRSELFTWMAAKMDQMDADERKQLDVDSLVQPVLGCLEDRAPEVRKAAQLMVPHLIAIKGFASMTKAAASLKPASRQTVQALLEKHKSAGGMATPTTTTAAPAKKSTSSKATSSSSSSSSSTTTARSTRAASSAKPSASSARSRAAATDDSDAPVLLDNNDKQTRANNDKQKLKWQFEVPRQEFVDVLKGEMSGCVGKGVHENLFHGDFRRQVAGMASIKEALGTLNGDGESVFADQATGASDVLLKYATLRFFDTNTSVLLKTLEVLKALFDVLERGGYHLSEYEASAFLPHLVNKCGDAKESVRKDVRALFRTISHVYPASKLFAYLMTGLKSKNSRVRTECLEEIAFLIERHGTDMGGSGALKEIVRHVGDRDQAVRNGALLAIAAAHAVLGDVKLFKQVGLIPAKDREMIEERLRRRPATTTTSAATASNSTPSRASTAAATVAPSRPSTATNTPSATTSSVSRRSTTSTAGPKAFSLDLDKLGLTPVSQVSQLRQLEQQAQPVQVVLGGHDGALADPTPRLPLKVHSRSDRFIDGDSSTTTTVGSSGSRSEATASTAGANGRSQVELIDLVLVEITSEEVTGSTRALKQLEAQLSDDARAQGLLSWVDRMLTALSEQLHVAFTVHLCGPASATATPRAHDEAVRLCKHVLNALMLLFKRADLARVASREPLCKLVHELIQRLLDRSLESVKECSQITKALNMLMLRVLENSSRNAAYGVLLELLSGTVRDTSSPNSAAFADLLMKCLWKLTKTMADVVEYLSLADIVRDCDSFLQSHPPSFWRREREKRGEAADMPLRTVKTIVQALVKAVGRPLVGIANGAVGADSMVRGYIDSFLQDDSTPSTPSKFSSSLSSSKTLPRTPVSSTTSTTQQMARAAAATPVSLKRQLADIFKKIGNKAETQQGLEDLYDLRAANPDADISSFLAKTSEFFKGYITRGLAQIEETRRLTGASSATPTTATTTTMPAPVTPQRVITSSARTPPSTRGKGFATPTSSRAPTGDDDAARAYRDRLRVLQSRYGITPTNGGGDGTVTAEAPGSLGEPTSLVTSAVAAVPQPVAREPENAVKQPSSTSTSDSVSMLKQRLAKIKSGR